MARSEFKWRHFTLELILWCVCWYGTTIFNFCNKPGLKKTRQALGGKSVEGATASLHGREMWTMLKRAQIDVAGETACERFYALAE